MPYVTGNIAPLQPDIGPMPVVAGVAVLTWRGEDITRRCLESLRQLTQWPDGIVVIDNASGTGEGERLADEFGVACVTTTRNDAVAGGYNAGIAWAIANGMSHVLLLNNDTVIEGDVLASLLAATAQDVAAVGPIVRNDDGTVSTAGGRLSLWTGRANALRTPRGESPYAVDWIDGSTMLVNLAAARVVGGLSPEFHLYWEETDWCARARSLGYRILVQPHARIRHTRGATVGGLDMRIWSLRNAMLFLRRHASIAQLCISVPAFVLVRVPVFLVRVGSAHGVGAAWRGLRDAVGWNLRDAARRGIRVAATGPRVGARR